MHKERSSKGGSRKKVEEGIYYEEDSHSYLLDFKMRRQGREVRLCRYGIPTLKEARKALGELKQKAKEESKAKAPSLRLDGFFGEFIAYRSHKVRESSLLSARSTYHAYLSIYKDRSVDEVFSMKILSKVYSSILSNNGISSCWKNRAIGNLRAMEEYAYSHHYLTSLAHLDASRLLENISEDRGEKKERKVWSEKEQEAFFAYLKKEKDDGTCLLFLLFFRLGARLGEFLGLTWDCVDFSSCCIHIRQQLIHNSQKTYVLSSYLKTRDSYRVCPIERSLMEKLREHKDKQGGGDFLFRSPKDPSLPLSKASFRYLLRKSCLEAGLREITPHAVRHMMASRLAKACKNMLEVQASAKYLGHSPSMMLDIYSHSQSKTILSVLSRLKDPSEGEE